VTRFSIPDTAWAAAEAVYPDGGPKASQAVLKALGHEMNTSAIAKHMERRGIRLETPENLEGRWTEQEIETLRLNAPRYSTRLLKERFFPDRTVEAIQKMASREGIRINFANREQGGRTEPMVRIPADDPSVEVRCIFAGDTQVPEVDYDAVRIVSGFMEHFFRPYPGPKYLFLMGDMIDCTTLSRFDHPVGASDVQAEIDELKSIMRRWVESCGTGTRFIYISGNHEHRIQKKIMADPSIGILIAPLWELLDFDGIFGPGNWDYVPYIGGLVELPGKTIVTHGYKIGQKAGYSAHRHIDNLGVSVLHGHSHRISAVKRTFYDRETWGIETGSLCVPQHYVPGAADWSLGFAYARIYGDDFRPAIAEIRNGRANIEGRWYE